MAAGVTYEPIATTVLGTATSSVTFSSISGSYTDLVLIVNAKQASTPGRWLTCRLNSDTGSNYCYVNLEGGGTSATSYKEISQTRGALIFNGTNATNFGSVVVNFTNYSNTTTFKNWLTKGGTANAAVEGVYGVWKSTAAINSILITLEGSGQNFEVGSSFTIYGIAAA